MISRILVPFDARPGAAIDAPTQRRRPTNLDGRTLVPAMLPIVPLNGNSTIPTNLPLESIAARVVVPRDVNREAYEVKEEVSTPAQPSEMDERVAVPVGAAPPELSHHPLHVAEDLVNPDIFSTGEVQLMASEQAAKTDQWQLVTRLSSIGFHILLFLGLIFQSKLFPPHEPTQAEIDLAQRQMTVLLPPGALEALKPSTRPPQPPPPKVNVDPRILRKIAPPVVPTPVSPAPTPERPAKELPSAPIPKTNVPPTDLPADPTPKTDAPKPQLKLETPDAPQPKHGLVLPTYSSSPSLGDTIKSAPRVSAPRAIVGGGRISGGSRGGGGGSGGTAYGGIELLTPDQGVDFNSYLQRVHDVIERNWFSVMPPSVELGDRGIVVLTFKIMRDGSVIAGDPVIEQHSGKEPLDRAAFSSVRASNPFERLPSQFSGPYIELRFTYLYNIPLEEYYRMR
jgi:hypothetical protein